MRDLTEKTIECMDMLDKIGIKYGNLLDVTPNTRARRWGQCRMVPGGYTINISVDLLDERNSEKGLKETIIHELLHTVDGCMNHGAKWKKLAGMVNNAFNMNIQRTSSAENKGVEHRQIEARHGKVYIIQCTGCGQKWEHYRMSKSVQHPEWYQCGKCKSKLERIA